MNLSAPRDEYCERLGPGLLAEPANALSNLAFFFAAFLLWRMLTRAYAGGRIPHTLQALPILIGLIGFGSSAYHTFAVIWAEILDVLFIGVFIYYYIVCFLHYFGGCGWRMALLGLPGFWLFSAAIGHLFPAEAFNGSTGYFPALFGIILMGSFLTMQKRRIALVFFTAAATFLLSLCSVPMTPPGAVVSPRDALDLALPECGNAWDRGRGHDSNGISEKIRLIR